MAADKLKKQNPDATPQGAERLLQHFLADPEQFKWAMDEAKRQKEQGGSKQAREEGLKKAIEGFKEQQASVTEPPRPIKCHAGPDCNAKWSQATVWVTEHSKYKLETSSESLIQTSGPGAFETDPSDGHSPAGR